VGGFTEDSGAGWFVRNIRGLCEGGGGGEDQSGDSSRRGGPVYYHEGDVGLASWEGGLSCCKGAKTCA
jgi:hypothetical protein